MSKIENPIPEELIQLTKDLTHHLNLASIIFEKIKNYKLNG